MGSSLNQQPLLPLQESKCTTSATEVLPSTEVRDEPRKYKKPGGGEGWSWESTVELRKAEKKHESSEKQLESSGRTEIAERVES